jgi:hypothetical protein
MTFFAKHPLKLFIRIIGELVVRMGLNLVATFLAGYYFNPEMMKDIKFATADPRSMEGRNYLRYCLTYGQCSLRSLRCPVNCS